MTFRFQDDRKRRVTTATEMHPPRLLVASPPVLQGQARKGRKARMQVAEPDKNCIRQRRRENEQRHGESELWRLRWQIAVLWKFFAVESMPNALNNIPQPSSRGRIK